MSGALAVTERTNTRGIGRGARAVSVEASIVGEDVGAIGAASLVLHGSYAPHLSVLLADVPGNGVELALDRGLVDTETSPCHQQQLGQLVY